MPQLHHYYRNSPCNHFSNVFARFLFKTTLLQTSSRTLYERETQGLLHIGESFPCHFPQLPLHELKMGTLNTKESLHTALLDHLCVYMYLFLYMYLYFHVYLYLYLYSHGEELCAEAITPYWTIPKAAFMHTPMI